ncbi:hypothetical protein BDD12DRAFT_531320 [Trichophaea hybrida]|nr:hypothetical protein BDD12DRAFT_531320 [Trichophaea hybrida]
MSSAGQREMKGKRWNWRRQEHPDPQGNEEGRFQPAQERDGGQSMGHTDSSYNTVDNSRDYTNAKHDEVTHSTIHGNVHIGDIIHPPSLPNPPIHTPTQGDLEKLVPTIGWDQLSRQLSVIDQDKHRSPISPFNRNEPNHFWISKNIDFTQWESADPPRALLLSAPFGHGSTEVCSHIINQEKVSGENGPVLYFFCLSATKAKRSTSLTHTLLYQIVSCSSENANSIAAAFLNTLVGRHFQRCTPDFKEDDSLDTTVKKVLDAPDNELIEALAEAIKKAGIRKLTIIVDSLWGDIASLLIENILEATSRLKALLTSRQNTSLGEIPDGILFIEYNKERNECLRFLQHDDTRYDKISEEHRGSLEWLWEHPKYKQWSASATSSLLYIEGKPGSGKSTLAKYIKKNLIQKDSNARSGTVGHYFYSFRGTKLERTHVNMLRSLLYGILEQDETTFFHFQQEFRNIRLCNLSEWPYDILKKVLSSFANHPTAKSLYLILDAMDESEDDDRYSIIKLLCNLCSNENPCNIKVLLASRPLVGLKDHIEEHQVIRMQDENKDDISKFADYFLKKDLGLTGTFLLDATNYIAENAQGVFIWVALVKSELLPYATGCTNAKVFEHLKSLPRELKDIYALMFGRLENGNPPDIQDGIRLFRLVLFALRPLTVEELHDAIAIRDHHNIAYEFQQNRTTAIKRRIEHCGGNFLEIKADGTVQFMHQTARDFLIWAIPHATNLKFEISDEEANRAITTPLIQYLRLCFTGPTMQDRFSKTEGWSPTDFRAYAEYLNEWPLIEYTLRYIKEHRDRCGQDKSIQELVTTLVQQLTEHQASYFLGSFMDFCSGHNNGKANHVNEHQETSENIKYNTLNAAADPKLPLVVKALLLTCTQEDRHAERKTPLIISAQKGLTGAMQLLLDSNVDKDAKDNSGRTALHHAVESGDEASVRLLVEKGAKKDMRDKYGATALHLAVQKFP